VSRLFAVLLGALLTRINVDPTSLIVIGHSMGGIVARAAFLHPHYQAHSISTLITIATPHVVPPATVDRGVDQVYDDINSYWRQGYGLEFGRYSERAREELSDSVMISLSGGLSDTTIASEAVSLSSLLPSNNSHGFTVFTTSIPGIYTPIDHLALLWCEQLLQKISLGILSIIDVNQARGVMNREARIAKLGDKLLGGLEIGSKRIEGREVTLESLSRDGKSTPLNVGERLIVRADELQGRNLFVMPIPPTRTYGSALVFTLLTSSNIGRSRDSAVEVYACSPNDAEDADSSPVCAPLFPSHASMLPLSSHAQYSPILPTPTEDGTLGHLTIDISRLQSKTSVVVIVKSETDWVLAEYGDRVKRVQVVEKTVLREIIYLIITIVF
jgi:glycosylphosphatidylinositol deacylase